MAFNPSSARLLIFFGISAILFFSGGFLLAFSFFTYGFVLVALGFLSLWTIWQLYRQTNRSVALFFEAIRNNDSTVVFPTGNHNQTLDELHKSLNSLNMYFKKLRLESEVREKYYQAIIRQSATGFVVMTSDKHVELINEAACTLAGISVGSASPDLLRIKNPALFEALCSLKTGENYIFKNYRQLTSQQLLLKASGIKAGTRDLMVYSIQDIGPELNVKEIESYQNLISILTHEIMNAMAPLTSISKTLNRVFRNGSFLKDGKPDEIAMDTTLQGLKAIEEQSEGLMNFVGNYRKLIKIPPPEIKRIDVTEWIQQLYVLYNQICCENGIVLEILQEGKASGLDGDKNLLNQVMVNLITNAIEALKDQSGDKRIRIVFSRKGNTFFIRVGNNGPVIPSQLHDKIFVPFFTTNQNGAGIGLSISGQIVKLHKGTIDVFSDETTGTIFTIKL